MIKPSKKQKRDGEIEVQRCEWNLAQFVMRGDYTHEQILDAAISNGLLAANERDNWETIDDYCRYYQCWFKVIPCNSGEYRCLHVEANSDTRGAYFASVVERF